MDRLKVLDVILDMITKDQNIYLCNAIFHTTGKEATKLFPELLQFKPEDKLLHRAWWNNDEEGKQIRIDVINKLIKILEDGKSAN